MEWVEANRIPEECRHCKEDDCYNCDVAGKRWTLSQEDELRSRRLLMVQGIKRLQQKIAQIDAQLAQMGEK